MGPGDPGAGGKSDRGPKACSFQPAHPPVLPLFYTLTRPPLINSIRIKMSIFPYYMEQLKHIAMTSVTNASCYALDLSSWGHINP